ncbi:hypothetical protein TNCV_3020721 [Trichonephila clavipes]|nr:hypothetical protein TNCV_3020721 [Trichonephila clavipes]
MDIPKTPLKIDHETLNQRLKRTIPNILKDKNKNCYICGDSSHCARDCEKRFKPKESNNHIHNRINVNTLKVESEKQNSDEFANYSILLYKKVNGAMQTSSVEFISRSPNPLPMKSKHRRFVLSEGSLSPGSGNGGKREIVLNRRPEL